MTKARGGEEAEGRDESGRSTAVRILQFGEGNFLRAFVDWMVQKANDAGAMNAEVIMVQPLAEGRCDALSAGGGRYNVVLRGLIGEQPVVETTRVDCIRECINPYTQFGRFIETARDPSIRFVVSNTTEAGISLSDRDRREDMPAASFPAKVLQWLEARHHAFDGRDSAGVIFLPCELIAENGPRLRECILNLASRWGLTPKLQRWIERSCTFCSTLVDRIVPGFPSDEYDELCRSIGGPDPLLVAGELFHLWVIESSSDLRGLLPLPSAGLNVLFTNDLSPWRTRKVRILNGAHTIAASVGLLCGAETIADFIADPVLSRYLHRCVREEIIRSMEGRSDDLGSYADSVFERFRNPFLVHRLESIALNCASKYATRVVPSIIGHFRVYSTPPPLLTLSLAALLLLYRPGSGESSQTAPGRPRFSPTDNEEYLVAFRRFWSDPAHGLPALLSNEGLWGENLADLPGLRDSVGSRLSELLESTNRQEIVKKILI
ncbi:tagaturonate reductase [Salinispira pacifica]